MLSNKNQQLIQKVGSQREPQLKKDKYSSDYQTHYKQLSMKDYEPKYLPLGISQNDFQIRVKKEFMDKPCFILAIRTDREDIKQAIFEQQIIAQNSQKYSDEVRKIFDSQNIKKEYEDTILNQQGKLNEQEQQHREEQLAQQIQNQLPERKMSIQQNQQVQIKPIYPQNDTRRKNQDRSVFTSLEMVYIFNMLVDSKNIKLSKKNLAKTNLMLEYFRGSNYHSIYKYTRLMKLALSCDEAINEIGNNLYQQVGWLERYLKENGFYQRKYDLICVLSEQYFKNNLQKVVKNFRMNERCDLIVKKILYDMEN